MKPSQNMFSSAIVVTLLAFLQLGLCCSNGQGGNPAIAAGVQYYFGGTIATSGLRRDASSENVARPSDLDCVDFANCRWRNAADDELDWSQSYGNPDPNAWITSMNTRTMLPGESFVLVSPFRPASDNGRLVSDPIGCIFGPIEVTLTVWRNVDRSGRSESAKLYVCSRLAGESGSLKAEQCAAVNSENGQPTTVRVQPPVEGGPAELVIVGYNFVTLPQGGAIFVRDVKVAGPIGPDCSSNPGLATKPPVNDTDQQNLMSAFDAPELVGPDAVDACENLSFSSDMANKWDTSFHSNSKGGVFTGWRFAKSTGNADNHLTLAGIHNGPIGVDQFALASFDAAHTNDAVVFQLVSHSPVTIPADDNDYFYCFDEFITLPAVSMQLCQDAERTKCFYHSVQQAFGSRTWTRNCPLLPIGTFKVHVVALYDNAMSSSPQETNEVGFVPDVITTNAEGTMAAC